MKTLFAFILSATSAMASPLADKVAELQKSGIGSCLEIRVQLCRPGDGRTVTNAVVVTKPKEQVAWEQAAATEIEGFVEAVTGDKRNALKRIAALDSAQMLAAVRAGKKAQSANAAKRDEIMDRSDALMLMYLDSMRATDTHPAYTWPLPDGFGQAAVTNAVVTTVPGKAWWQREGLKSPPTIDQISNLMK